MLGRRHRRQAQHWVDASCLLSGLVLLAAYCWLRSQADTDPMSVKCWASVTGAGQYSFSPSQYFILSYLHAGYSTVAMLSTKAGLMLARRL